MKRYEAGTWEGGVSEEPILMYVVVVLNEKITLRNRGNEDGDDMLCLIYQFSW